MERLRYKLKQQETMSGNTNRLVNQESRGGYGEKAVEGATAILQGDNEFDGSYDNFEKAQAE